VRFLVAVFSIFATLSSIEFKQMGVAGVRRRRTARTAPEPAGVA
jgi:hypothetical protein